jgi:hypothetical protein
MDIENDLRALDTLQISILFWKEKGLSDKEIGKKFGWGEDWVETRMGEIYKELGFDTKMHARQKKKTLEEEYLPVVKLLTNDDPETLADWPLQAKKGVDQNRPKSTPPTRRPAKSVDQPRPNGRSIWTWLWIPIMLLLLGALYGAFWLGRSNASQPPLPTTVTVTFASTQVDPTQASAAATENISEAVSSPTISVSDTPLPTDTPASSNTPSHSPVPSESEGFFDNFDNGLSPEWIVVYGNPVISNGQLQAGEQTLLSVGDTSWTDYTVEFDVNMGRFTCGDDESSTLGVRANDIDNMLLLRFHPCETEWSSVINGNRNVIPGTFLGNQGFIDVLVHFIVTVEGNKITFREKSDLLNSLVDTDHPSGNVYLKVRPETVFDNFKITLLNP